MSTANKRSKKGPATWDERARVRVRMYDRAHAKLMQLSADVFEARYKVRVVQLEDNRWYAECPAHSYHSLGYENRHTAEIMAELHVKYYHTVVVM